MDMNDLHRHRLNKDHEMKNGHLSKQDRDEINWHRFEFLDKEDKQYHSPDRPPMQEQDQATANEGYMNGGYSV